MMVAIRSSRPVPEVVGLLREAVHAADADIPVADVSTAEAMIARSTRAERFRSTVVTAFAVAATLLSAVGLFGVTARAVASRRRELGIRLALGARSGELVRRVVSDHGRTIGLGLAGGMLLSFAAGGLITRFLFATPARDPLVIVSAMLLLGGTGVAASVAAARHVTRLAPVEAIRVDP